MMQRSTSFMTAIVCLAMIMTTGCNSDAAQAENSGQIIDRGSMNAIAKVTYEEQAQRIPTPEEAMTIRQIEQSMSAVEGHWDVAIKEIGVDGIMRVGVNSPMAQQSVSKIWVAMAIMDRVERGELKTTDTVSISKEDRAVFHQPLARKVTNGPAYMTIGDLLLTAITKSDNMANQILLDLAGGPEAVRKVLRENDIDIRFGPGDRHMQSAISGLQWNPSYSDRQAFERARQGVSPQSRTRNYKAYTRDPVDGSTAEQMVLALEQMAKGNTPGGSAITQAMGMTTTGRSRLKSGTPKNWKLMHKTGTGQVWAGRTAGFNDVGILTAPDGRRFAVAILIGDSASSQGTMQKAMQQIARLTTAHHSRTQFQNNKTPVKGFQIK